MACPMPAPCSIKPAINAMCDGLNAKRAASTKAVPGNMPPKAENRMPATVSIPGSVKPVNTSDAQIPIAMNDKVNSFHGVEPRPISQPVRFGSALNLNVHFRVLFVDSVCTTTPW